MNRLTIGLIALFAAAGIAVAGLLPTSRRAESSAPSTASPPPNSRDASQTDDTIIVDAKVVPARSAALSFEVGGRVAEVLVQEGEAVAAGAPLARLDIRELDLKLEEAKAALAEAQASYDNVVEGASEAEVEQARAQVARAEAELRQAEGTVTSQDRAAAQAELEEARASLAQLQAGPKPEQVAIARAELEDARVSLAQLQAGPKSTEVQAAQAALEAAQANMQSARDQLSADKTKAQLVMEQASNLLEDRQAEYSRIYWENRNRAKPTQADIDAEQSAMRAVENAEREVAQARVSYEEMLHAERSGVAAVEAEVQQAQAGLELLLAGAEADQLAAAQARVVRAEATLSLLLAGAEADQLAAAQARVVRAEATLAKLEGDQRQGNLDVAVAGVVDAEAVLEQLTSGPRQAILSNARAQVLGAQVLVKQAELALERAILRAPMAGTIAEVNVRPGEVVGASEQAAIVLADLSSWQIETVDVSELSVVDLREGMPAQITFYALPGFELPGEVAYIKPLGSGDVQATTYTIFVTPEQWDERLRWNMSATVSISTGKER
jgi:HlyD family secretion protein